jgi:hypothetical protein
MGKIVLIAAIFTVLIYPPLALASEAWIPEARFSLEGGELKEIMLWVSGFSYAIEAVGKGKVNAPYKRSFCSPKNGYIGSKALFEILNEKFSGQTITSEQATAEIMKQLPIRFAC